MGVDILGFAYAVTVAAGGYIGYAKAGLLNFLFLNINIDEFITIYNIVIICKKQKKICNSLN